MSGYKNLQASTWDEILAPQIDMVMNIIKEVRIIDRNDDYRIKDAHPSGGFAMLDKAIMKKYRSVAKEMIKRIGSQVLRGKINLTSVSFPIKWMGKLSHLECLTSIMTVFPSYLTWSAYQTDPVERMKWFMVAMISTHTATHHFEKPLNPILGETLICEWEDGTKGYAEQTSHKPPVTHAQFYGPDEWYVLSMYSGFAAKAGLNSITLKWTGKKSIIYKDGGKIYSKNTPGDVFKNTFWGTIAHQFTDKIEYFDDQNGLYAWYEPGKKKVQDYIFGAIEKQNGGIISELNGTYWGYIDFDGERYWDVRDCIKFPVSHSDKNVLPSDSRHRIDLISYEKNDLTEAQNNKEKLEILQRHDAKLRGHH